MIKTFINAWKVKDIRAKMIYTLILIVVYRLGSFIPVPSVDGSKLGSMISQYDFLSFLNLFSGGSLNQFSIFAMGISPYITASIIMLACAAVGCIPFLVKFKDEPLDAKAAAAAPIADAGVAPVAASASAPKAAAQPQKKNDNSGGGNGYTGGGGTGGGRAPCV